MKKYSSIKEEDFMAIIREEYQRAKRELNPLLSEWHFSAVKFQWGNKIRESGAYCNKFTKTITFNPKYRDNDNSSLHQHPNWTKEMFRLTLRHELCHLLESNHGSRFLYLLSKIGGHRRVGQLAYTRSEKKI